MATAILRATARAGYICYNHPQMAADDNNYQRKPTLSDVRMARASGVLHTLEGPVAYQAGDAIVTGVRGEQWPIPRHRFEARYEPADAHTAMGQDGPYRRKTSQVQATQTAEAVEVVLSGDRGALKAKAGDWLVRDAQGERWVVADGIFQDTYIPLVRAREA